MTERETEGSDREGVEGEWQISSTVGAGAGAGGWRGRLERREVGEGGWREDGDGGWRGIGRPRARQPMSTPGSEAPHMHKNVGRMSRVQHCILLNAVHATCYIRILHTTCCMLHAGWRGGLAREISSNLTNVGRCSAWMAKRSRCCRRKE